MHDAGGAEHRQAADNAEARIPGLQCQVFSIGDRNLDLHVAAVLP